MTIKSPLRPLRPLDMLCVKCSELWLHLCRDRRPPCNEFPILQRLQLTRVNAFLSLSANAPDFAAGIIGDEQRTVRRHGNADGPAVGFKLRFIGDKTG